MTKARKPRDAAGTPEEGAQLGRLIEVIEDVAQQLRLIREAVDELREEFVWAIRNDVFRFPVPECPSTTTIADSEMDDEGAQLPDRPAVDPPAVQSPTPVPPLTPATPPRQGSFLFDAGDGA